VLASVAEVLSGLGWGVSAGIAAAGSAWALAPLLVTLGMLALAGALAKPSRGY
jgi:hypothetical protein